MATASNMKLTLTHKINKELTLSLTSSRLKVVTERPSPPDQRRSCLTEGQDTEKKEAIHLKEFTVCSQTDAETDADGLH